MRLCYFFIFEKRNKVPSIGALLSCKITIDLEINSILYVKSAKEAKRRFMRCCYLTLKLLNEGLRVFRG